jgi:hypothetical protein
MLRAGWPGSGFPRYAVLAAAPQAEPKSTAAVRTIAPTLRGSQRVPGRFSLIAPKAMDEIRKQT